MEDGTLSGNILSQNESNRQTLELHWNNGPMAGRNAAPYGCGWRWSFLSARMIYTYHFEAIQEVRKQYSTGIAEECF